MGTGGWGCEGWGLDEGFEKARFVRLWGWTLGCAEGWEERVLRRGLGRGVVWFFVWFGQLEYFERGGRGAVLCFRSLWTACEHDDTFVGMVMGFVFVVNCEKWVWRTPRQVVCGGESNGFGTWKACKESVRLLLIGVLSQLQRGGRTRSSQ